MKLPESIIAVSKFVLHIIALGLGFVVLMLVALGLSYFAAWLEAKDSLPDLMVMTVYGLEWLLFAVDVICFIIVLLLEAWSLVVEIWKFGRSSA